MPRHISDSRREMLRGCQVGRTRVTANADVMQAPGLRADRKEVKTWHQCTPINREPLIRGLHNELAADTLQFDRHTPLIIEVSDVADDGVGIDHVETLISITRESAAVTHKRCEWWSDILGHYIQ